MKPWLLIPLVLAGCATPEEIAHRNALRAEYEAQQQAAYREGIFSSCDRMGFSRGTEGHANCALRLHQQNLANNAALGAALLQGYAAQQQKPSYRMAPRPALPQTTNCTRDPWGNVSCVTQ
jgi:hypothetical protein